MPTVAFNICSPRDCVCWHNGGTSGAPHKPLRDDNVLRVLSSLRDLRGAPEVPPLCRETSVSRTASVGTMSKNWLWKKNTPASCPWRLCMGLGFHTSCRNSSRHIRRWGELIQTNKKVSNFFFFKFFVYRNSSVIRTNKEVRRTHTDQPGGVWKYK